MLSRYSRETGETRRTCRPFPDLQVAAVAHRDGAFLERRPPSSERRRLTADMIWAHTLPAELWDAALDQITDPCTLSACCLVCRAWLPRARHNLLKTVVVAPNKRPGRISMSPKRFCQYFSEDARARLFVESLDIGDLSHTDDGVQEFIDLLGHFRGAKVRALTLRYCSGGYISQWFLDTCKLAFANVTQLDLDWSFSNVGDLSQLLRSYKSLRQLTLRCLILDNSSHVVPPDFTHPCAVRFESPTTRCVLSRWAAFSLASISEIWVALEEHTYEILNHIADERPEILSRVKSLTFDFDAYFPAAHLSWHDLPVRLQQCTQLEELHFTFTFRQCTVNPRDTFRDELKTILNFPPTVRRITMEGTGHSSHGEWTEIGEILTTRFPLLEALPSALQPQAEPSAERNIFDTEPELDNDHDCPLLCILNPPDLMQLAMRKQAR